MSEPIEVVVFVSRGSAHVLSVG